MCAACAAVHGNISCQQGAPLVVQGEELAAAVDAALRSVNLYRGGVADKQASAGLTGRG